MVAGLRQPCPPEECELQNDCEFGFDQDCNCLPDPNDPTNENNETGINIDLSLIFALNQYLEPNLTPEQIDWIFENEDNTQLTEEILSWLANNPTPEAIDATNMTLTALSINKLLGPYDAAYYNAINPFTSADLNQFDPVWTVYFSVHCAIIKAQNPTWSDTRVYWEASKEMLHLALDIGGLVPVIGEICDVTNGIIYTIEGEGVNAALSYAGAIPIAGWFSTGAKFAYKGSLKFVVKSGDIIDFGARSNLRKTLGLVVGNPNQAHHLIPWALRNNDIIQKAAKSGNAFHMNEVLNGVSRPSSLHLTGHQHYNDVIEDILLDNQSNIANPEQAYDFIEGLANHIKDLINTNPNLNSGEIADLIEYP